MKHRFPRRPWRRHRNRRPFQPGPTRSQARQYVNQLRNLLRLEAMIEAQRPAAAGRLEVLDAQIGALNEILASMEDAA